MYDLQKARIRIYTDAITLLRYKDVNNWLFNRFRYEKLL